MSDDQSQVHDQLIGFIAQQLLNDRPGLAIQPEDDLLSSQWVDSLGVMRIVAFMEDRYRIKVPPADVTIENFLSVQTMGAYIQKRRDECESSADS